MDGRPVFAFGGAAEDDLGGFRGGGEGRDVGYAAALDGEEGEDEGEEDGEEAHADGHIVLYAHDYADADDDEDEHRCPHPGFDHLLWFGGILNEIVFLLVSALLEVGVGNAILLAVDVVQLAAACTVNCFADEPEDLQ